MLAVLVGGGGADDLDLAARQGRLEDRGGVERALGGTGADERVHLVDEQDDALVLDDLGHDALEAVFELAAVLGAGRPRAETSRVQTWRPASISGTSPATMSWARPSTTAVLPTPGSPMSSGLFFGAAREHLHDALGLGLAADDRVELALARELGEVAAVLAQGAAVGLGLGHHAKAAGHAHAHGGHTGRRRRRALGGELADGVAHGVDRDAHAGEGLHGHAVALAQDAEEQVLGGDVGLAEREHLAQGALEHAFGARGKRDMARRRGLVGLLGDLLDLLERILVGDVEAAQRLGRDAVFLANQAQQQMLGADVHLPELAGLLLGKDHDLASAVGKLLEHEMAPPSLVLTRVAGGKIIVQAYRRDAAPSPTAGKNIRFPPLVPRCRRIRSTMQPYYTRLVITFISCAENIYQLCTEIILCRELKSS